MTRRDTIDKLLDEALDACLARVKKCCDNGESNGAQGFANTAMTLVQLMQMQSPKGAKN